MSVISSPAIFKRISGCLPSRTNSINPTGNNSSSNNSTCPLPQSNKQQLKMKNSHFTVSHDITMLYELFSSLWIPTKLSHGNGAVMRGGLDDPTIPICLCCERKITSLLCQPNQCQYETFHNKYTSALFYGSFHVKKYMKSVMTKKNLGDIIEHGFPCPHTAISCNTNGALQYYCEHCEKEIAQDTIRLTLTPAHCRAQDNEIYNASVYNTCSPTQKKQMNKRRGRVFFIR